MMSDSDQEFSIDDIGDATVETKQVSPIFPFYADSTYGFGYKPNG